MKYKTALMIAALAGISAFAAQPAEAHGSYCREYTETVRINGFLQTAYGTACMQPDGSWLRIGAPAYQPVAFPAPRHYYAPPPQKIVFFGGHKHRKHDRWDKDRWDRRGHNKGRGHHHHR